MKQLCKQMAGTVAILFILAACSENNSNYPEAYVGFNKTTKNYSFDKSKDVEEFDIKIIAAEKKKRRPRSPYQRSKYARTNCRIQHRG